MLTEADDHFHPPSEDPWETETCWFSFCVPERALMAYLYSWVRPNKGVSGGGVLVWDHTAHEPWELPYFEYQWHLPMPTQPLTDCTFPNGMSVKLLEPLMAYRIGYHDAGRCDIDVEFHATTPPHPFTRGEPPFVVASHLDQPGRVTGTLVLHGETIAVDCYAMRDRSWGPRTDLKGIRVGYCFATASASDAFLAFSVAKRGRRDEPVGAGYLLRDGIRGALVSGTRSVERDLQHGWVTRVEIEASDEHGRELHAVGVPVNRVVFLPYPRMLNWTSMMRWSFDGATGWGEDQDVWRPDQWRAFRAAPVD